MNTKFLMSLASGASLLALASAANAALINDGGLTLDTNPSAIYGQTSASPCVIGGNNCQNPVGFLLTDAPTGGNGNVTRTSPTYNVSQITSIVGGNTFTIGLDYNQTSDAQSLFLFTADYDVGTDQTFDVATVLQTNNNGVGFSDFLLSGFVIPQGATTVTFTATWLQNDGADRYFLIGANSVPVPEPSTLAVLGMGLLGLGALARRRKA